MSGLNRAMLHVMDISVTELKRAVEAQHCKATVFQSVPIKETFGRNTVWEGVVHIFSLTGHPTAKRAYAWSSPLEGSDKRRLFAVLHQSPVTSPVEAVRAALAGRSRCIVTPTVAKHRLFAWLQMPVCPDHQLIVIARDDDTTFGILHSRFHEAWALGLCTWLGVGNDPRYTPSTTFETFPFPDGLTPNIPASAYASNRAMKIADAAKRLNEMREAWLNPSDLVRRVPEVVPGFPDRILPVDDKAVAILKKRTLTNLYNERPAWLANAHSDLDAAVAVAYGWAEDISEDEAIARLFALNQSRARTDARP